MRYNAVLFDLDGTIIKSEEGILNCVEYALRERGHAVPPRAELYSFIGPPLPTEFARVTGCDAAEAEELTEKYRERYRPLGIFECELYDGIADLLTALHEAGVKVAVATSKPEIFAKQIVTHFGLDPVVDVLVGAGLDECHSSKYHLITTACERLGIDDRAKVVMVGDRCFDVEGALAAGTVACGVTYGYGSQQELTEAGAHLLAHSAADLKSLFL